MGENDINLNIGPDSFSVDAILAEYKAEQALFSEPEKKPEQEAAQTHRIVYDSSEQALGEAQLTSSEMTAQEPTRAFRTASKQKINVYDILEEPVLKRAVEEDSGQTEYDSPKYIIKTPPPEPEPPARSLLPPEEEDLSIDELIAESEIAESPGEVYAAADDYEERAQSRGRSEPAYEPDFRERVITPVAALLAAGALRREKKRRAAEERRAFSRKEEPPELRADRAADFYATQAQSIKLRCILASAVTLALLYLSIGLPAAGLLGNSPTIKAIVCIVLELVVMVIGLDVFTGGVLTFIRGKAGAETLIAVSCIVSICDAAAIALSGNSAIGLPFCGASALSLVLALWGNYFSCMGFSVSFETASKAESPTVVLAIPGIDEEGCVLARSKRPVTGFVRASEASDLFESSYRLIAPVLIAGSVILSLFCYFASEKCDNLLHTLAACTAASASLSAVFGFAFPFYVLSKRLAKSGAAVAGYSGVSDLGRVRRVLVSDTDIFPVRTLSITDISISENARPETVMSYTGSMIAAAGMGIAPVFMELLRKNGYSIQKVESFACHEGGGLAATINGDTVYVGTSGFMQLMGIRLPRETAKTSAVYTAINNGLTGIVSVGYKPVASVQRALVTLLRGRCEPLFAVRDFNLTPMLVKQKFRLPTDSFNFPSFADRYRISSPQTEESGMVSAVFTRGGINSVAGLCKRGRGLYNRLRVCLSLSVLGAVLGLLLMLMFCWTGSYDSASCGNLIAFMLLWLVPTLITSLGLQS